MFERIGIGTGRCPFCGTYGPIGGTRERFQPRPQRRRELRAVYPGRPKGRRAAQVLREAKAPKAKKAPSKARKPRIGQPRASAPHPDEADHEPVLGDRELAEREL